jgi:hypothetical protein
MPHEFQGVNLSVFYRRYILRRAGKFCGCFGALTFLMNQCNSRFVYQFTCKVLIYPCTSVVVNGLPFLLLTFLSCSEQL